MWPSQRLASIGLDSRQRNSRARSKNRRGIRPIVTLLEERTLLSTLNLTVTTPQDDPTTPIVGQVTLRDAITTANADTVDSQEIINFAPSLNGGTIDLTAALPALSNNISINGPGSSNLTVQRDSSAAQFSIFSLISDYTHVIISGMTIAGGDSSAWGGGIYSNGTLTVNNSTFIDNAASYGGGIYVNLGSATVTGSTFIDNIGSAIHNEGALTVVDGTFTGNSSSMDGGGISNFGSLSVSGSTFTDNSSTNSGGGILSGVYAPVMVNDSTFTDNSAAGNGGGIYSDYSLIVTGSTFIGNSAINGGGIENNGAATLINSTFTTNSSTSNSSAIGNTDTLTVTNSTIAGNLDGGIVNLSPDSTSIINNTIVANNAGNDVTGYITEPMGSNNLIGIEPMLGPLANNGGPTETMALLPGSPAIGAGSVSLAVDANGALQYDQRGPGYPRTTNGTVDIGAYESEMVSTVTTLTSSPDPSVHSQSVTFTATVASSTTGVVPTGTVTFQDYSAWPPLPGPLSLGTANLINGVATLTLPSGSLAVGTNSITAVYNGDTNYDSSTSIAVAQIVNSGFTTATTLTSSSNQSAYGQPVTFTATITSGLMHHFFRAYAPLFPAFLRVFHGN